MTYIKINESKLNLEDATYFEWKIADTPTLFFNDIYEIDDKFYTRKEVEKLDIPNIDEYAVTPMVEYWMDENKWKYVLLYSDDTVLWDISDELRRFVQKKIAEAVCDYNNTGCSDCEFNKATDYSCPLGKGSNI